PIKRSDILKFGILNQTTGHNIDNGQQTTPTILNDNLSNDITTLVPVSINDNEIANNTVAFILSPDKVQKILNDLGFEENKVASWNRSIEVPIGVSSVLFTAREAILHGLHFQHISLYPAIESEYVHKQCKIPEFVSKDIQSIDPGKIIPGRAHRTFPQNILVCKEQFTYNDRPKILDQIKNKFTDRNFLYRGTSRSVIPAVISAGFDLVTHNIRNEFGPGLYTTPDIDYALRYCGQAGVLLVFDWTDSGGNITVKDLLDDEWMATVKGWICIDKPEKDGPPQHIEDVLQGKISENYDNTSNCRIPRQSMIMQVVGKTEAGRSAFAARLIAIIYQ
ncbi:2723_t:CDS:2, partial [Racocetra fulgida]